MKASCLATLLLLLAAPAGAATRQDEQFWFNGTVTGSLKGRALYFVEVQPRFGDGASRFDQLLLRPAIGWRLSPAVSAYAGYAHVVTAIEGARDRNEERLFLQLSWTLGPVAGGTLSSRSRVERRQVSSGDDIGWRLRNMVRYVHPLGDRKPKALVWAEPFVALDDTDWGARAGFDQLRGFAGVEVPLKGKSTVEIGYMNQWTNQAAGNHRVNHIASVTLFIRP